MGLWQELDHFQDLVWKCSIDGEKYKTTTDKERLFEFLYGLNKDLDEVRAEILGFKPFPEIKEAFAGSQARRSSQETGDAW